LRGAASRLALGVELERKLEALGDGDGFDAGGVRQAGVSQAGVSQGGGVGLAFRALRNYFPK